MGQATIFDIALATGNDALVGLIDETARDHPEMRMMPASPMMGRQYYTWKRTALGNTSGNFRLGNAGVAPAKHTYEKALVETYILNALFIIDQAVGASYPDGAKVYTALQMKGTMEGVLQSLCKQMYYGAASGLADSNGFPGLLDSVDSSLVLDAGGTTASTGSSVWAVKFGLQDVIWRWGDQGSMNFSELIAAAIADPNDSTKIIPSLWASLLAFPGLQVGEKWSCGRIKKLTEDSGKGVTDSLLAQLYALFPVGKKPDAWFMSRRSHRQLQVSRTVTLFGSQQGAPATNVGTVAPAPTEACGIPIGVTDAILDTESLTL